MEIKEHYYLDVCAVVYAIANYDEDASKSRQKL